MRVDLSSFTGLQQKEFIIDIFGMVLWFFFEFLQYVYQYAKKCSWYVRVSFALLNLNALLDVAQFSLGSFYDFTVGNFWNHLKHSMIFLFFGSSFPTRWACAVRQLANALVADGI